MPESSFITATNGCRILVDAEDQPLLARHRWHDHNGSWMAQALADGDGKIWLQHLILGRVPEDGLQAVCINGDHNDLRKANLAWVGRGIISHRMERRRPGKASVYRGVLRRGAGWIGCLIADGVRHSTLAFPSEIEAAKACDELALKHHGAWAVLNFPPPDRPLPEGIGRAAERDSVRTIGGIRLIVDPEDAPILSRHDWVTEGREVVTYLHGDRVPAYALVLDATRHQEHMLIQPNGDPFDLSRANLAWVQVPSVRRQQEACVRGIFRGVRATPAGKFAAEVRILRRTRYLGSFQTAAEAALAVDEAVLAIYGPEAALNFPDRKKDG